MGNSNGSSIVRIGRKGIRKFAFGEAGPAFSIDVVVAFQEWIAIDDGFRPTQESEDGGRAVSLQDMPAYHAAAKAFVEGLAGQAYQGEITTAEALDFIARLREQYDELATFFRPRLREERDSPVSSEGESELRFSHEGENAEKSVSRTSTS